MEILVEQSRANCERRIRESENLISGERKNLVLEIERFEEKKRDFVGKTEKFASEEAKLDQERRAFDEEVLRVKDLAEKVTIIENYNTLQVLLQDA